MNTTFRTPIFARFHITLPASLLVMLYRADTPSACVAGKLDKGTTTWIATPLGRTVHCETGTLWLTFDNEPTDVVLDAGQSHRCAKASKLAIHAFSAASVSVT